MFTAFHHGIHFIGVAHFKECVALKGSLRYIYYSKPLYLSIIAKFLYHELDSGYGLPLSMVAKKRLCPYHFLIPFVKQTRQWCCVFKNQADEIPG